MSTHRTLLYQESEMQEKNHTEMRKNESNKGKKGRRKGSLRRKGEKDRKIEL